MRQRQAFGCLSAHSGHRYDLMACHEEVLRCANVKPSACR